MMRKPLTAFVTGPVAVWRGWGGRRGLVVVATVLALIVATAALGLSFYRTAARSLEDTFADQMHIMAVNMAESVTFLLKAYRADTAWMTKLPELREIREPTTTAFLERERANWPNLYLVGRLDRDGRLIYLYPKDVLAQAVGKNFAFREYFQRCRESGKAVVSSVILAGGEKNADVGRRYKAFLTAAPVFDRDGRFDGVVLAAIGVQAVADSFILPTQFGRGYAWMLDEDLSFLVHPKAVNIGQKLTEIDEVPADLLARIQSGQSGHGFYTQRLTGDQKLVSYASVDVDGHRWPIGVTLPRDAVDALLEPLVIRLILLAGGISLLLGAVGYWMWRKQAELRKLRSRVRDLEIQIDAEKKEAELSSITESAYFQGLLGKLDELRSGTGEGLTGEMK